MDASQGSSRPAQACHSCVARCRGSATERTGSYSRGTNMIRTAIAVLALMLVSAPTEAAKIVRAGDEIFIIGAIQQGDDTTFNDLAVGDKLTVYLSSTGGHLTPALRIGEIIRAKQYTTVVPNGASCNSSCAFIWVGGVLRKMGSGASLAMHCAYLL